MPVKPSEKPILKRAISKSEMVEAYGVTSKVFRQWCKRTGLDMGRTQILTPKEVDQIIDKLGEPPVWPL